MEIIFSLLFQLAFFGLIVWFIVWLVRRANRSYEQSQGSPPLVNAPSPHNILKERDQQWIQYILDLQKSSTSKTEKALLQRMLDDNNYRPAANTPPQTQTVNTKTEETPVAVSMPATPEPDTTKQKIDGTLLLLYFGAFLFVASTGLFVAFAGLPGVARTLLVIFVMLVMYFAGFWLYARDKVRQAGVAFVAIGMAIAPLVGPALFSFVTDKTNAPGVWLLTSLLCLTMYSYALYRIRTTFIGYLVIFSFLSVFESGVAITTTPAHYLVWGMLAAGLVIKAVSLATKSWPELRSPADISVQLVVPLTVLTSIVLVAEQGYTQLWVALLLAGLYYVIEGWTTPKYRAENFIGAHIALLAAIAVATFSFTDSTISVATSLLITASLHIAAIVLLPKNTVISRNFASLSMVTMLSVAGFGYSSPGLVVLSAVGIVVIGIITAIKQDRADAFTYAATGLIALPLLLGQLYIEPTLSAAAQSYFCLVPALILLAAIAMSRTLKRLATWRASAQVMFVAACGVALTLAFIAGPWTALAVASLAACGFIGAGMLTKDHDWAVSSGLLMCLPVVYGIVLYESSFFMTSVLCALIWNIITALYYRQETSRWVGAVLWLLLPLAFGLGGLGFTLEIGGYAYAYLFAMLGLIISRAVARGLVFTSSHVPIESFMKNKSFSYAAGYTFAGIAALVFSLSSANPRLHTSLTLAILVLFVLLLARAVEKRPNLYALIPFLSQGLVYAALYPGAREASYFSYTLSYRKEPFAIVIVSCLVALGFYAFSYSATKKQRARRALRTAAIVTAYASPAAVFFFGQSIWVMPITFMIAAAITLHGTWERSQGTREWWTFVMTVGFAWLMGEAGVTNFQAYSHLFALLFAGFAYWRWTLQNELGVKRNLYLMFFTATVPLVFQALSGVGGDVYGWWLLLEQVLFMIIGAVVNRRFLITLGLYTGVAAVLYQLRDLGWAALLVLAVFIIGIAIKRLAKLNKN